MAERKTRRLRGERNNIKIIDRRFERGQVLGFRKARRRLRYSINCTFLGRMVICGIEVLDLQGPLRPVASYINRKDFFNANYFHLLQLFDYV